MKAPVTTLPRAEALFLTLLRGALHATELDPEPFIGLEDGIWRRVHRLATQHAVPAFVGDRVLTLPKEALPNRDMRLMIFSEVELTKRANAYLAKALRELTELYQRSDLDFLLLKGLGVSEFYPTPQLRAGGDLDILFFTDEAYEEANNLLLYAGYHLHDDSEVRYGHTAFTYGRTIVENHARAVFFDHKRHNVAFERALRDALQKDELEHLTIDGLEMKTLPHELNVVYIFIHLFFHWLHWGVGFRQYCDWLLMMTRLKGSLDLEKIQQLIQELEILYPMQLFAEVAIRYLDVAPEIFPFPLLEKEDPNTDRLLWDVLQSGNFGFAQRPAPSKNRWVTNWRKFWFKYKRTRRLYRISPVHTSRILWGSVLGHLQLLLRPRR